MQQIQMSDLPKPRLLDQVRRSIRVLGYSQSTEDAYCSWIKRFILYHNKRHPDTMAATEVELFLTYLADIEYVSASTQNQALSALLFLYKHVLHTPLDQRIEAVLGHFRGRSQQQSDGAREQKMIDRGKR